MTPPRASRMSAPPGPGAGIWYRTETRVRAPRRSPRLPPSLLARRARREARAHHQPSVLPDREPRRLASRLRDIDHAGGDPEVRGKHAHPPESLPCDADDDKRMSVQPDALSYHCWIGVEAPRPVAVAQHRNRTGARVNRCRRRRAFGRRRQARRAPERNSSSRHSRTPVRRCLRRSG